MVPISEMHPPRLGGSEWLDQSRAFMGQPPTSPFWAGVWRLRDERGRALILEKLTV